LRAFKDKSAKKISGPKRQEITEEWRRVHNKELHNLHMSQKKIKSYQIKEKEMRRVSSMYERQKRKCI